MLQLTYHVYSIHTVPGFWILEHQYIYIYIYILYSMYVYTYVHTYVSTYVEQMHLSMDC